MGAAYVHRVQGLSKGIFFFEAYMSLFSLLCYDRGLAWEA